MSNAPLLRRSSLRASPNGEDSELGFRVLRFGGGQVTVAAEDWLANAYRLVGGYFAHLGIKRFRGIVLGEEQLLRPPIEGQSIFPSVPPRQRICLEKQALG